MRSIFSILGLSSAFFCSSLVAATVSFDLTSKKSGIHDGSLNFHQDGIDLRVSAFGQTGHVWFGTDVLQEADVTSNADGLGVCNASEYDWWSCNHDEQAMDNGGDADFLLFFFEQTVTFNSITLNPEGWDGADISYAIATTTAGYPLAGLTPYSGIFGDRHDINGPTTSHNVTHGLNGRGNAILVSALSGHFADDFRISAISVTSDTAIPLPASAWLFGSAILGLVGLRRKA